MKIWNLEPINSDGGYWDPWYDKVFGVVVAAESEDEARKIAQENGGCESRYDQQPWLDSKLTTCIELNENTAGGLICQDYRSA